MPIIEIDKSVLEEIENAIERKDKMYENHIATTKKLTDSIEKLYEQEVKQLKSQLQQKENIIKEASDIVDLLYSNYYSLTHESDDYKKFERLLKILDKGE